MTARTAPGPSEITTSTEWLGGTQTRTVVALARRGSRREFAIESDYPDALLGSGAAPSPDELFLAALGSSFVTSFVLAAAAADIRIELLLVRATRTGPAGSSGDGEVPFVEFELRGDVVADAPAPRLDQLVSVALASAPVVALCSRNVHAVLRPVDKAGER